MAIECRIMAVFIWLLMGDGISVYHLCLGKVFHQTEWIQYPYDGTHTTVLYGDSDEPLGSWTFPNSMIAGKMQFKPSQLVFSTRKHLKPESSEPAVVSQPVTSTSTLPIKTEEDHPIVPGDFYDHRLDIWTIESFDLSEEDEVISSLQPTTTEFFPTAYNTTGKQTPTSDFAYPPDSNEEFNFAEFERRLSVDTERTDSSELSSRLNSPIQLTTPLSTPEEDLPPSFTRPPFATRTTIQVNLPSTMSGQAAANQPAPLPNPAPGNVTGGQNQNPPPMPAVTMSMQMPYRRDRSAPAIYDEANPGRELSRYLQDLESLFSRHSITNDQEKKRWLTHYPSVAVADFWESLREYNNANMTYDDFKNAILKQYPDADTNCKYEHMDLERVIGKYAHEVSTLAVLGTYYREFYPKAQFLEAKNRLSSSETGNLFSKGFPKHIWDGIMHRLQIKLPDHHPSDPYMLNEIYEAAQFVLQGTNHGESLYTSTPHVRYADNGFSSYNVAPAPINLQPTFTLAPVPDPVIIKSEPSKIALHLQAIEDKIAQLAQLQI
ncbi:uncharacterized protein EV420DRAFT_1647379 [Desarmillaria tabescens]|uniref:Retrotransposon gag domain-containing protein n=1 Tax=Armillaria tabescens TaxID=1929756 RepID=A0AA39JTX3_ARMTA|nr:uncharacterized protein EV420DRAFT_1647379 [Desarmillaria tabescens]KAK0448482.1 hypothetical protein EV420DRAFT_1647379 [Desarmillaria tabescens]